MSVPRLSKLLNVDLPSALAAALKARLVGTGTPPCAFLWAFRSGQFDGAAERIPFDVDF